MLVLDNGDKIQGDASAATIVDYTMHGLVGSTLTQLADGQLAATKTDMYTASGIVVVSAIVIVNTDTVTRTINLYLLPSAGTARRIIAKSMSLQPGFSLHYDGVKVNIVNTIGGIVTANLTKINGALLPAEAAYLPATTPAELKEIAGSTTKPGYSVLNYDDSGSEFAFWEFDMPVVATTYKVTISWVAVAITGNVMMRFGMKGVSANEDILATAAPVTTNGVIGATTVAGTTLFLNKTVKTGYVPNDALTAGQTCIFMLERYGADAGDTMAGDMRVKRITIELE